MAIDTGEVFDSTKVRLAQEKLDETGLFSHVKIHTILHPNKVMLLVVVREKMPYSISSIGGVIYNRKYGEPTDRIWLQGYGAITNKNFRGMHEQLRVSLSLWSIRYLGLSWFKPFINTPYFMRLSTKIGSYPQTTAPWHMSFYNASSISGGRKLGQYSEVASTISGTYKNYTWKGGDGDLYVNGILRKEPPSSADHLRPLMVRDEDWIVTINDTTYEWDGYVTWKIKNYEDPFTEAFFSLVWSTDKRDNDYNPTKGYTFGMHGYTNALWPYEDIYGDKQIYFQINNEFRFYHRGFWKNNIMAYRARSSIKPYGKGNVYSGMYMGNERTLRGFASGEIGSSRFNHRLLFSYEYRFPIYTLPAMRFPWLAWYDNSLNNFIIKVDGGLFFDCGYVWEDLENFIHPSNGHKGGAGAGFGLRFVLPSLKQVVSADFSWPIHPRENIKNNWPIMYLYLDLPF